MGIIEDGSFSGVLDRSKKAFAIHYPGYPSSNERAIQTLGGMEQILKVRADESNKLELNFRPEDPNSHTIRGELQPCNKFLLKISKRTVKDTQNDVEHDSSQQPNCDDVLASSKAKPEIKNGAQEQLSADIVAWIPEEYHFNEMADYQYVLPVHADALQKRKRNLADVDPDTDQDDELNFLVPPRFSKYDDPRNIFLDPQEFGLNMEEDVLQEFGQDVEDVPQEFGQDVEEDVPQEFGQDEEEF